MKKYCAYLLILCYLFTAQLSVHSFAMHGGNEHSNMSPCGHTSDTEEKTHDMTMCLEQSMGAFVGYTPVLLTKVHTSKSSHIHTSIHVTKDKKNTIFSFHDPGWNKHGNFSAYRKQLYGHGIVMHC